MIGAQRPQPPAVLIFRIGSMGDTAVALPAFRQIRRDFPDSQIILLTNTPVDGGVKAASSTHLLAGMGLVDHSIEYPHGSRKLSRLWNVVLQIRARRPALCFFLLAERTPQQAARDRIFFRLAGIRRIIGLQAENQQHLPPRETRGMWESEAARLMRAIGHENRTLAPEDFSLCLTDSERNVADRTLREAGVTGPFIAMSLGSKLPVKDWGDSRWSACLESLGSSVPGMWLVAIGSKDEFERTANVLHSWPGKTANLCGRLIPRESAAVIQRARLFLGHDSGPMHLASAVGTPLVAIFSARSMPGIWFPFGQESNAIYRDVPCRGCKLDDCIERKQACVTQIQPTEVVARALQVLAPLPA